MIKIQDYITSIKVDDQRRAFTYPYNVFEHSPKKEGEEYSTMEMKHKALLIELERQQVAASIDDKQIEELKSIHGIDVESMVKNALENEVSLFIWREVLYKMRELSKVVQNEYRMKWWNQIFGYWNPPYNMDSGSIAVSMLKAGNNIAKDSRRGAGNFAIVSGEIGNILKGEKLFEVPPESTTNGSLYNGYLYKIGSFGGIEIIVDSYLSYTDKDPKILVGRKTSGDEPGIIDVHTDTFSKEVFTDTGKKLINYRYGKVTSTPGADNFYYTVNLTKRKYPFWDHLKARIKNLFKWKK